MTEAAPVALWSPLLQFPSSRVPIHHTAGRHLWWPQGEQLAPAVVFCVSQLKACTTLAPLSVGLNGPQILKPEIKRETE